jgi:uncharacterized protein YjbI with pentapeptide repeats
MDRTRALYLLSKGPESVARWNRWRLRGEATPNLSRASFVRCNQPDANLSEMALEQANFTYADLTGATFMGSDLTKARFGRAVLVDVTFENCNLTEAEFHYADLGGAVMADAQLLRTNFTGAYLCGADLSRASFQDCSFKSVQYDARTKWPEGFDPGALGLTPWPD